MLDNSYYTFLKMLINCVWNLGQTRKRQKVFGGKLLAENSQDKFTNLYDVQNQSITGRNHLCKSEICQHKTGWYIYTYTFWINLANGFIIVQAVFKFYWPFDTHVLSI